MTYLFKKIFLIALVIFVCFGFIRNVEAANLASKWFGSYGTQMSTSATRYLAPFGQVNSQSPEASALQIAPSSGTVQKLRVQLDTAPGSGKSYVITFRKELANTALTCTVSDSATSCSDLTNIVAITAGDRIALTVTPSGTPTAARVSFILEFVPTTNGETVLMGSSGGNITTGTSYGGFTGVTVFSATESNVQIVIPSSGTLKNLYTFVSVAPGTSNGRTFTLRKNAVDTALTTIFTATDSGVISDTTHTVTVAAGDTITLKSTETGTPATATGAWGIIFVPDTVGDFIIPTTNNLPSTSAVNYLGLSGANAISATESQIQTLGSSDYTLTAAYVKVATAPGSGKSWTTGLRQNSSDAPTTFGITISGTSATTGSVTGQSFTPTDGALFDTILTPSGTPASSRIFVSYLGHTASDITAPVISSVASSTTNTTATITWTTDEAATSTVNYGATASYGTASTSASSVTSHSITLTGLTSSTLYHFQVSSQDASGNVGTSADYTFTTVTTDTTAPTPGNSGTITTASVTGQTLTLNWTKATDNISTQSNIQYEVRQSMSNNVDTVSNAESNGSIIRSYTADINTFDVTGLTASTTYYFNVIAKDEQGNKVIYTTKSQTTAAGITYYVDNTNGSASDSNAGTSSSLPWLTIGKCASTIVAGDTCQIQAGGTYDEAVTPTNSGVSGVPIVYIAGSGTKPKVRRFNLTNKSYITINGLEFTNTGMTSDTNPSIIVTGSTRVEILNNYIHDTASIGVRANPNSAGAKATYLHIQNNTISYTGSAGARVPLIELWGNDSLIEGNDLSHGDDFTRVYGQRNVVRNNTMHDSVESDTAGAHIDGIQSFCTGTNPAPEAANYLLIEGNNHYDNPDLNSHFALINGTNTCGGSTEVIIRYNKIYNVGSFSYVSDTNNNVADNHKYYNNTTVNGSVAAGTRHVAVDLGGTTNGSLLNNIFVDAITNSAPRQMYGLKSGDSTSNGDYNLGLFTGSTQTWASPINDEVHHILNTDPQFVSSTDFNLQSSSPAINTGGSLTTVATADTGTGTTLVVNDAHFFQPGWAGVDADWIAVGTVGNIAQISSIDYTTNTITLASGIARNDGDSVWLYKNSEGTRVLYGSAPDLGAYESSFTYTIGGTISGLSGTVVLQNNSGDNESISTDGSFIFDTTLNNGASYSVTVLTQPSNQTCTVSSSSGTVSSANVTNISVTCSTNSVVTSSGGGSGSPAIWTLPTVPPSGFKLTINSGALTTSNRNVFLGFNAGTDIKKIAVSMTGDFTDATQEDYTASKQWDLCSKLGGLVKNPTCPNGTYTVYAKFYTAYGRSSNAAVASNSIALTNGITNTTTPAIVKYNFTRNLSLHSTGKDVKALQQFLNANGFVIAKTGAGSPGKETTLFGTLTYKALVKFQKSLGWSGTGFFGPMTRAYLNKK